MEVVQGSDYSRLAACLLLTLPWTAVAVYKALYPETIVEPPVKVQTKHHRSSSIQDLLDVTFLEDLSSQKKMIVLEKSDKLDLCLMTLEENSITSIPIVDLSTHTYIGLVSILDIAAYLATLFPDSTTFPSLDALDITAEKVVNFSQNSPFLPQKSNLRLKELIALFSTGVHRVPILNEEGQIIRLLTETDVFEFVLHHEDELFLSNKDKSKSVFELDVVQGIGKVLISQTVASAIPKVSKVGALAVIDSFGVFVGELSAKHFRSLSVHNFMSVYKTIAEWRTTFTAITAREDVTLAEVMIKMGKHHVNRVWIIDSAGKPVGVVRCQDVLRTLISESE